MQRLLVIGYGNTLRGDDAIGPKVAEAILALALPGCFSLVCQLLTPELADPVSKADAVIFVDAGVGGSHEVQFSRLAPFGSSQVLGHAASPQTVLALARDVFGHAPDAWLLTVPGVDFSAGEELSPTATLGLQTAVEKIRSFANDHV